MNKQNNDGSGNLRYTLLNDNENDFHWHVPIKSLVGWKEVYSETRKRAKKGLSFLYRFWV